jgi:hypothetical protein
MTFNTILKFFDTFTGIKQEGNIILWSMLIFPLDNVDKEYDITIPTLYVNKNNMLCLCEEGLKFNELLKLLHLLFIAQHEEHLQENSLCCNMIHDLTRRFLQVFLSADFVDRFMKIEDEWIMMPRFLPKCNIYRTTLAFKAAEKESYIKISDIKDLLNIFLHMNNND